MIQTPQKRQYITKNNLNTCFLIVLAFFYVFRGSHCSVAFSYRLITIEFNDNIQMFRQILGVFGVFVTLIKFSEYV